MKLWLAFQVSAALLYIVVERDDKRKNRRNRVLTVLANQTTHNRCYSTSSTEIVKLRQLLMTFRHVWSVGLVAWFSLRVREVPGSTPGQAQIVLFLVIIKIILLIIFLSGSILHQMCPSWGPCNYSLMSLHFVKFYVKEKIKSWKKNLIYFR